MILQYQIKRMANFNYHFIQQHNKELWKEYMFCLKEDFDKQPFLYQEYYYSACQKLSDNNSE